MDYLKSLFHEFLNEDGDVIIAGYPFSRDNILKELESEGYSQAFEEWLVLRREENLARANDILNLHNNRERFDKLKEIHVRGAVIPFIGAGLSKPCGYQGWTQFLYEALNETRIQKQTLDDLIENGMYEEAAQMLQDNLPDGSFFELIENAFGIDKDLNGPVQMLPKIFKNAVITTNFDSVLRRCYGNTGLSFHQELFGADAQQLPKLLGENKRVLVSLHGNASLSRNRVFTQKEYETHYAHGASLTSTYKALCHKSLLFIGCSLSVDRTMTCMSEILAEEGYENLPRHYAFIQLKENDDRLKRRDQLAKANIYPIWYTEDHDSSIEALLEALNDGIES